MNPRIGVSIRGLGPVRQISTCLAVFALVSAVCFAYAKDVPRMKGVKFATPPTLDGTIAEGEWGSVAFARGFTNPFTGAAPQEDTEVWLGYSDEAIYVAFVAHESEPAKIVAQSIQPGTVPPIQIGGMGGGSITEDVIEFSIDPFNTRQGGMSLFRANARGTTSETIAGGRSSKREFRGQWEARATVGEDCWTVEMRIPWAILNLPIGSKLDMDINFARAHAREQVASYWADTTLRRLPERLGLWTSIDPPKQKASDRLNLMAYVAPEYDEDGSAEFSLRSGGDVRYAFTSQLTGLASVNPDFKNIEQQVTSISFTRSSRFESDNRPFFSEGSGFFGRDGGGMSDQLFYSRAITDFDEAAKFYGVLDKNTTVGALATHEDGDRTDGVFNLSRTLGPRSSVSMFMSRSNGTGLTNSVYGLNGRWGKGNYRLSGQYSVAEDAENPESAGLLSLNYSVPRFNLSLSNSWVEPSYRPELGFVQYQDRRGYSVFAFHNAQYQTGSVRSLSGYVYGENFETFDDHNQSKAAGVGVNWTTRDDIKCDLGGNTERFFDEEENTASAGVEFNASNRQRTFGATYVHGSRARELTEYLESFWNYRLENGIDLGLRHSFLNFQGRDEQSIFTVAWEKDAKQSFAGRIVRTNDDFNYYLSYSSSGFTGLDWFLIIGDPNATQFRNRISLKFVWAK